MFDADKIRTIGIPCSKEIMTVCFSRFHRIPACDGRTDGQTDIQRDRQTDRIAISISHVSVLTRDKNGIR